MPFVFLACVFFLNFPPISLLRQGHSFLLDDEMPFVRFVYFVDFHSILLMPDFAMRAHRRMYNSRVDFYFY